jgi:hypothetical protein
MEKEKRIPNSKLLTILKKYVNDPTEEKLLDYAGRTFIRQNPTYKQLREFRDCILNRNKNLKINYFELVNDMMVDIAQNRRGESLKEFKEKYLL